MSKSVEFLCRRLRSPGSLAYVSIALAWILVTGCSLSEPPEIGRHRRYLGELVTMQVREPKVHVGSFSYVDVSIDSGSGLKFDELSFQVVEPEGGFVSQSKDFSFEPARPTFLLAAGWRPGTYSLEAISGADDLVGTASYEVTLEWDDPDLGPPLAIWDGSRQGPSRDPWEDEEEEDLSGPCEPQWGILPLVNKVWQSFSSTLLRRGWTRQRQ
ncbi:MAG TPA: hypothetical protein VN033_02045 [Vulgatibacter sp.]|nr:hypothetical protein [Vulgatibacter sp.]